MELRAFDLGRRLKVICIAKKRGIFFPFRVSIVSAEAVITVCVVGSVSGYYGSCSWQCYSGNYDFLYLGVLGRMRN